MIVITILQEFIKNTNLMDTILLKNYYPVAKETP